MLEVIEPGASTTVQDVGRQQGQSLGIPPSGAQDTFSLRIANLLVGNDAGGPLILRDDPGAAGLEMLLVGPKFKALAPCVFAVTGGDVSPKINGKPVPQWQALALSQGDVLSFGTVRAGVRAYLAVMGGIDVPLYLGSRSTHLRGGFGGLEGRALRKSDTIRLLPTSRSSRSLVGRRLRSDLVPSFSPPWRIRVVPGPDDYLFTTEWKLSPKADRTGFRYVGPRLHFPPGRPEYLIQDAGLDPSNIVIDPGAPVGTIQVPSGVEPIVMGVDSPTIGGYARIGVVISTDMARVGQTRPGETTFFERISQSEATDIIRKQEALLSDSSIIIQEPSA